MKPMNETLAIILPEEYSYGMPTESLLSSGHYESSNLYFVQFSDTLCSW